MWQWCVRGLGCPGGSADLGFGGFGLVGAVGLVWAAGDAPVPGGHGGFRDGSGGGEGGVEDGEAGAPFKVGDEGGTELGVGGKVHLVGGLEEEVDQLLGLAAG